MKNKKYHAVGTIPKSNNTKYQAKSATLAHIYTTVHFPGLALF